MTIVRGHIDQDQAATRGLPAISLMDAAACPVPKLSPTVAKRRGARWVVGSFLLCPCHLPFTLALLSGTAAGAALHHYPYAAAAIVTLAWALGTWRGLRHFRAAGACTTCAAR